MKNETSVTQASEREMVITRTFNASARIVFEAWTQAEHMRRWWVPQSSGLKLLSCEMDVRTGGGYRFVFENPGGGDPITFFGRYLEVTPYTRLVWTNDESGDAGQVSTLTVEERGDTATVVLRELFPSKEALEAAKGAYDGMAESFAQLDALLAG